ncbi:MAG: hypothetical protein H6581_27770 [Bacteroidia bacterium]|nr:hypothetical protein [Bacteroidia bacterium]
MNNRLYLLCLLLLPLFYACKKCDTYGVCQTAFLTMKNAPFTGEIEISDSSGHSTTYSATATVSGTVDQINIHLTTDTTSLLDTTLTFTLICNVKPDEDCKAAMAIVDYKSTGYYEEGPPEVLEFNFIPQLFFDAHFTGTK